MATHSSILAQEIPWTEEPGGLQSMGSQRVRYDPAHSHTHTHTHTHTFIAHILLLLFFPNPHLLVYPFSEHQSVVFFKL